MNEKAYKILGIGEYCYDYIMVVEKNELYDWLNGMRLPYKKFIAIQNEAVFRKAIDKCKKNFEITVSSGGTVTNALYAIAYLNTINKSNLYLMWKGIKYSKESEFDLNPLDNLKRTRCRINFVDCKAELVPKTLCFIDRFSGETLCIIVPFYSARNYEYVNFEEFEYAILDYFSLSEELTNSFNENSSCKIILLIGDNFGIGKFNYKSILKNENFVKSIIMVSCDKKAYNQFGLNHEVISKYFKGVKFLVTNGEENVHFYCGSSNAVYSVNKVDSIVSTLGAGDAYLGSFLYYYLMGNDEETSHTLSQEYVSLVLKNISSQIAPETDLNKIFPKWIDRESCLQYEGGYYQRIRKSPGTVFISGGQSGVDQLAIQVTDDLELPSYAILPMGLRTDSKEGLLEQKDNFGHAYIIELSSRSYRFRTWAAAYYADLSMVWDKSRSEGTVELEKACSYLNKPLIYLNDEYERVVEHIFRELYFNDIKVINIAGNRKTTLNSIDEKSIMSILNRIIIKIANFHNKLFLVQNNIVNNNHMKEIKDAKLRIGIANSHSLRNLLERFLNSVFNLSLNLSEPIMALNISPSCSIYFARAREVANMIKKGIIDLAICGNDILSDTNTVEMIYKTGLCPVYNVIVGKEPFLYKTNSILSQYPELNGYVKHDFKEVINVSGSIESYINLGLSDYGIDSWSTGYTANTNHLDLVSIIAESSISIFVNKNNVKNIDLIIEYIKIYEKWLSEL